MGLRVPVPAGPLRMGLMTCGCERKRRGQAAGLQNVALRKDAWLPTRGHAPTNITLSHRLTTPKPTCRSVPSSPLV